MEQEQTGSEKHQELFKLYQSFEGEAAFEARTKQGRQPVLDIAGYPYFVNLRTGLLEPVDWPAVKAINLEDLQHVNVLSSRQFFYYDPATREQLPYAPNKARFPAGAIRVEIPAPYVLDPVGEARRNNKEDLHYYLRDAIADGTGVYTLYHHAKTSPAHKQAQKPKKSKGKKL